jgi:CDP-diacylglycerol--glycerol-3-phosphate 3-phosphatidyltransferase
MNRELLTLPNLLSLTRIVLLIPFVAVMCSAVPHRELWGFGVLVLAGVTDRYDGILARRRGMESELGRILDPLADKIGTAAASVLLTVQGYIPVWFLAVVAARDLLIFAGGVRIKRLTGEVLASTAAGKWAMGVVFVTICGALLRAPSALLETLLGASVVMLGVSLLQYALRYRRVLRTHRLGDHGTA